MKPTLLAALCAIVCGEPSPALAQDEDDWEFQHEASLSQIVAAVRYDAGVAIVVQCRDNALSAALVGMPAGVGGFEVQARRADDRTDTQTWAPGPQPGVFLSTVPARDIRFMRGGGLYSVRTPDGAPRALRTNFDLPTQSANLDRVLSACGWGLTDDRDQLTRVSREISFRDPDARPRERPRGRGARPGLPDAPEPAAPVVPTLPPAERQMSCVLQDLKLTSCRFDHPAAPALIGRDASRLLEQVEGTQMYAPEATVTEGRVFYSVNAFIRR